MRVKFINRGKKKFTSALAKLKVAVFFLLSASGRMKTIIFFQMQFFFIFCSNYMFRVNWNFVVTQKTIKLCKLILLFYFFFTKKWRKKFEKSQFLCHKLSSVFCLWNCTKKQICSCCLIEITAVFKCACIRHFFSILQIGTFVTFH